MLYGEQISCIRNSYEARGEGSSSPAHSGAGSIYGPSSIDPASERCELGYDFRVHLGWSASVVERTTPAISVRGVLVVVDGLQFQAVPAGSLSLSLGGSVGVVVRMRLQVFDMERFDARVGQFRGVHTHRNHSMPIDSIGVTRMRQDRYIFQCFSVMC